MRLGRAQAFGVAVVEHSMVKAADAASCVVLVHGLDESLFVQPQLARQLLQRVGFFTGKHRRHEAAHGLGVND